MKSHIARKLVLLGTLAGIVATVACSKHSTQPMASSQAVTGHSPPAALETVVSVPPQPKNMSASKPTSPVKPSGAKTITYRSRDYGVSFVYPWQYAYVSARTIANSDATLRPESDGYESQITLARVEIPKGFYPDTNFESGYFALSLNANLDEDDCHATLGLGKDGQVKQEIINGMEFRWNELDSGARGNASKVRNYVRFANDTCYEVEMAVKTKNEQG